MAALGRFGKFPFRFGGEPSLQRKAFDALVTIEGVGFTPGDDPLGDQTIDGAWHQAIASGLGALASFGEAAVWQAFPTTVSDLIPEYERILDIIPPLDASDESRRQVITHEWLGNINSDFTGLLADLRAVDSRFAIQAPDHFISRGTDFGKVFDPLVGELGFGGAGASRYPNFSDDYSMNVLLDVGEGVPATGTIGQLRTRGEQIISDSIPAWCDYNLFLDAGFVLDRSLLDVTALT